MNKHQTGEMTCPNCDHEFKWLIFYYADLLNGEKAEWIGTDGYSEVNTKKNKVVCPNCKETVEFKK